MRIIDAHVHVLDDYRPMAPFGEAGRVDRLLRLMDGAGVEKAVMLPVVAPFSPTNNEDCARWAREHPDRLAVLADVPLHEADAAARVARAREEYGAVGISCYSGSAALRSLLAPASEPLWAAFAATGLVCNLHVGPPDYPVLVALASRHPAVRFVANHLGVPGRCFEPDHPTYGGLLAARSLDNLLVKASGFYGVADRPWDWRCPRALGFLRALLHGLGVERVLWGTDWPPTASHLTYRQALEVIRNGLPELPEPEMAAVLGGNAARVFGI